MNNYNITLNIGSVNNLNIVNSSIDSEDKPISQDAITTTNKILTFCFHQAQLEMQKGIKKLRNEYIPINKFKEGFDLLNKLESNLIFLSDEYREFYNINKKLCLANYYLINKKYESIIDLTSDVNDSFASKNSDYTTLVLIKAEAQKRLEYKHELQEGLKLLRNEYIHLNKFKEGADLLDKLNINLTFLSDEDRKFYLINKHLFSVYFYFHNEKYKEVIDISSDVIKSFSDANPYYNEFCVLKSKSEEALKIQEKSPLDKQKALYEMKRGLEQLRNDYIAFGKFREGFDLLDALKVHLPILSDEDRKFYEMNRSLCYIHFYFSTKDYQKVIEYSTAFTHSLAPTEPRYNDFRILRERAKRELNKQSINDYLATQQYEKAIELASACIETLDLQDSCYEANFNSFAVLLEQAKEGLEKQKKNENPKLSSSTA